MFQPTSANHFTGKCVQKLNILNGISMLRHNYKDVSLVDTRRIVVCYRSIKQYTVESR